MPIYDYVCQSCYQPFDLFLSYEEYGKKTIKCPHCSATDVKRRIARPRMLKSDDSRMDSLTDDFSDPSALAGLEEDPRAMGHMMRKMGRELGEELPPEFNEVVDRLEKGQSPDEIEKELPNLGQEAGFNDSDSLM